MKALVFYKSIWRYLALKTMGPRLRWLYSSPIVPVSLQEIDQPRLPGPHWARVAPRLSGICGSDLAALCAKGSPYLAPLTSMPFVMGHEVVGDVVEIGPEVSRVSVGDRVVLRPALGCRIRGVEPKCDACSEGRDALCREVLRGVMAKGIQTGYCRDTGGGFGENFVAQESQLYRVPGGIDDFSAVLIEPFACAAHGALRVRLEPSQTALVIGCGAIGLLTIAALRAFGCRARIVAVGKYDHQQETARAFGADVVLPLTGGVTARYEQWAKVLGAEVVKPELGKPTVLGGAAAVFDCVATGQSIDDGIRFTQEAGTFVLVGMPGVPNGVDWTAIWHKELRVCASYAYGPESTERGPVDTFELVIEQMRDWAPRLRPLVGKPFALEDYRKAFACALNSGATRVAKTVFQLRGG